MFQQHMFNNYEYILTEMKNCGEKSLIKLIPNVTLKMSKNCELLGNICHNTTQLGKPIIISTIFYHGSMKVYNFTNSGECKSMKKSRNNDIMKIILTLNGLRACDEFKLGVRCSGSSTTSPLVSVSSSKRTLEMMSLTAKTGDTFRMTDRIAFENGGISCTSMKFVVMKSDE